MKLYHGTDIFSANDILQNGIDLTVSRYGLDFGAGFYVTPRLAQARVWAEGTIAPCVLSMELDEAGLERWSCDMLFGGLRLEVRRFFGTLLMMLAERGYSRDDSKKMVRAIGAIIW